jgi:hypothetical protein
VHCFFLMYAVKRTELNPVKYIYIYIYITDFTLSRAMGGALIYANRRTDMTEVVLFATMRPRLQIRNKLKLETQKHDRPTDSVMSDA